MSKMFKGVFAAAFGPYPAGVGSAMAQRLLTRRDPRRGLLRIRWVRMLVALLAFLSLKVASAAARRGWHRRRVLAPSFVGVGVWLAAAIAHLIDHGWATVLALAVLAAIWLWRHVGGWLWMFTRRRGLPTRTQTYWYAGCLLAWSAWAVIAAVWGPGPPRLGWLLVATVAAQVAWAWRHRRRIEVAVDAPVAVAVEDPDPIKAKWAQVKGMATTTVASVDQFDNPKRVVLDIDLTDTDLIVADVTKAVPYVAKVFTVPRSNVIADYAPGILEDLARVEVVYDNPCHDLVIYDETWIPTAEDKAGGITPFHLYPNGRRGSARLWYPGHKGGPGAGACGSFFSGDPGSGKSAGQTALFTQQVFTGLVWPMAACPQNGQSMPAWTGANGQARWKAACGDDNLDPIAEQLEFLREAMYWRSDELSRFRWTDRWGDEQIGLANWDPIITGWPAIGYSISEAWRLMLEADLKAVVKELVKLQRKTGIYMNLDTQYPGIQEFGNDPAMRQPISAGNQFAYRNSSKEVKAMTLPDHLPPPNAIPDKTPTGEHTKGTMVADSRAPHSSVPVFGRSVWVERELFWAKRAVEHVPDLDEGTDRILRRYLPSGASAPTGPVTEAGPRRETVTAGGAPPVPARSRETIESRVVAYLSDGDRCPNGRAHTGVIARDLGLPLPRVSEACGRAAKKNLVHQVRQGVWAVGAAPATGQLMLDEQEGSAA